ncbi:hypothetical protein [uncultured Psychrobacter sp.]|uniref:hypothetical protein n=1 Tax=uncultured Psychrobacter sp. TaxID=259303 RepID=UPI002598EDA8|nr:hypothetical protein [uncultured Psychrobacter sp.]
MDFFEAISFSTNLEREQYISVLQLIEMVKHRNGVGIEKAVEFLGITHVANLCVYSCQRTFEKDFDYQSIGVNQKLGSEIYGIACFEDIIKSDRSYQGKYEDALDELNKQYFKRLDLLSLEIIVENTDIVTCGDRLVLQRMYSDIIQRNNNVFLALPQKARNAILEFLEPKNQNNDYVRSITQQLADEKNKVAQLIAEREQVQSTGSFSMGNPTVAYGEPKTNEQLINELAAANDQIAKLKSQLEQSTTDKRSYTTPAIDIMDKVITEFWIDYDPSQPAPKQSTITAWITKRFDDISYALALNIDKVCRHSKARSGGKYKR